jgi:hypothetical protein
MPPAPMTPKRNLSAISVYLKLKWTTMFTGCWIPTVLMPSRLSGQSAFDQKCRFSLKIISAGAPCQ